ncbi:MAG: alpha/beta hydrolase [Bacteroidetes bacterium]|nr:MAG: alpha/beta hydrolase [Bacteroidota bacterium]REK04823.1 MAG: alpha/beta hydrolase [Bacteroidota bacterium]REK36295.1 MAG: alpha/beta hydrolase [Bacteroidota bacterium]REK51040.1 MAG: alpha/beta hydrolase [Bacteroidota bacterium]
MSLSKIYYLCSSLLLFLSAFVFLSPGLISPDMIYPKRIDSVYIELHDVKFAGEIVSKQTSEDETKLFNPLSLGIPYTEFKVVSDDALQIDCWFIPVEDSAANTIVLLHDLNESKILYLEHIKQFHDRGLNVCAVDLRAHGKSEGLEFSAGLPSVRDIKLILDQLLSDGKSGRIILYGKGTGAAIAIQVAVYDGRCDALILQNPMKNFNTYLNRYSHEKWGIMQFVWKPVFRREVEKLLEYSIKDLNLTEMAAYTKIPSLFISDSDDRFTFTTEILSIYDSSAASRKSLFLVREAADEEENGAGYFNRITEFINKAIPRKPSVSRYKKLA